MRTVVIYPGRFHPFHRGHLASYELLARKFGPENVFIATSDKQAPITSPFGFGDKQHMMAKLGVPVGKVIKVKNPYKAEEILSNFDPDTTSVIFAVSQKDADRFSFGPKKDGSPSYMQPYPKNGKGLRPFRDHGYIMLTPTVPFKLPGTDASSATEIRNLYTNGNDEQRNHIIAALYGDADKNIKSIFDKKLVAAEKIQEFVNEMRVRPTKRGLRLLESIFAREKQMLSEDSEHFVIMVKGQPVAKYETPEAAKQSLLRLKEKFPKLDIAIYREFCSLRPIDLKENLKNVLKLSLAENADYLEENQSNFVPVVSRKK